jgi:vitamin K-dependent gamma-carboxylase
MSPRRAVGLAQRARAVRHWQRLAAPVDAASLVVFRVLFGLLMLGALLRSWQKGIIEQAFIAPTYFFPYYGWSFVRSPGVYGYALYGVLGVLALAIACGLATRWCAGLFCLLFTYAHFVDVTNYLNHYVLVSLLAALLTVVPTGRRDSMVPTWALWLFRFQFGVVYFFGGVAKLKHDWLFLAQPLRTWLAANTDVPLLGAWFARTTTAHVFSWLGAFYDLTITFWLLWRRTRPYAYLAVVFFHLLTARLFQIGLFPYLMMIGSLLFLAPDWPRRLLRWPAASGAHFVVTARQLVPLTLYVAVQVLVPLRHWLYPGNVLWTEQGYRFAWNVMLIEKTAAAEFTVVDKRSGQRHTVFPRTLLSQAQTKAMSTQPDMILAFAHELARRDRLLGHDPAVYADVLVVLNGRAPARLVDPTVDLAKEHEGFAPKRWLLPAPD